jgi:hypothetical protein
LDFRIISGFGGKLGEEFALFGTESEAGCTQFSFNVPEDFEVAGFS